METYTSLFHPPLARSHPHTTPMTVIQSLPVELLRQILADLDPVSLRKISLVSHLFNNLAEPFHYDSLGHSSGVPVQSRGWLLPILFVLVKRPEMARYVRCITFCYWAERYPTPDNCILFSAKAKELGIPDIGWWDDAQALFLLHLVPDVQELTFSDTPLLRTYLEQTIATPIADVPFQSLSKFTSYSPVTLRMLLALMRLPSLRSIKVYMPYTEDYSHDPILVDGIIAFAGQSSVTQLSLHTGDTSNSMLQLILQMPRVLTALSYMYDREYGLVSDTPPMHTVLQHVRPALQSLSFGGLYAVGVPEPCEVRIGSLRNWPALTTLHCSLPALLGSRQTPTGRLVDVLPLGIRRLFLWRKDEHSSLVKSREQWNVWQMTEQLVEVLQNRPLDHLTVNTCARVYTSKKGWFNQYEERVKERLTSVVGTGRCEIVCF